MIPQIGCVGIINGYRLIESKAMVDTISKRAKTHRQKRIDKQWLKKYGFKVEVIPKKDVFIMDNNIIGHPEAIRIIKEAMEDKA